MTSRNDFQFWFAMGLLLGSIVAIQVVAIVGGSDPAGWIDRYQVVIGAVMAVLAAVLALGGTLWIADARRRERLQAARAMLPFALSNLYRYSQVTTKRLNEILPANDHDFNSDALVGKFRPRKLPQEAFVRIAEVIELADVGVGRELSKILSRSQYYSSRLDEVSTESETRSSNCITPHGVRSRIIDHLELSARISRCFNYARFSSEVIRRGPITLEEIQRESSLAGMHDSGPELRAQIERHLKHYCKAK